jgi:N-acetylglucosaminyldiphosphoundecaprenol N-acetyl-beta-D-mannosaminyltransferase
MYQQSVTILGVQVHCIDREALLAQVLTWARGRECYVVAYVNAHCLNLAASDSTFKDVLNQANLVYVDGIGVVFAGNFLGYRGLHKITGRAWIDDFCNTGAKEGLRIFLLAGKPGVAEKAGRRLEQRYPGLVVCGTADGYFEIKSEAQVIAELEANPPQLLWVGMGSPIQEKWVARNRAKIRTPVIWTVGALFDYVAELEKPVPAWLDRLGLEWLWRLLINPREKWQRYILGNPQFVGRVFRQKFDK